MNSKSDCLSLIIIILSSKAKLFFTLGKMIFKMRLESALCSFVCLARTDSGWDVGRFNKVSCGLVCLAFTFPLVFK